MKINDCNVVYNIILCTSWWIQNSKLYPRYQAPNLSSRIGKSLIKFMVQLLHKIVFTIK